MYKNLVQQIMQQNMHNNCISLLKKRFVFTKLVESPY